MNDAKGREIPVRKVQPGMLVAGVMPDLTVSLYHGTRRPFAKGGLVLPGDEVGADNHDLGRNDWVYVTPDLDLAWAYAEAARGRGHPRVLEVAPCGPLYVDDSTVGGAEQESYRCEAAVVVAVLRCPAPVAD